MSKLHLALAGAMALVLLAAGAPRALAFAAQGGSGNGGVASSTYVTSQQSVNLSPIVVYGQHIPFPVALQVVKKALKRPWSSHRRDLDKLVCNFIPMRNSHFQTLFCETNRQYFRMQDKTQLAIAKARSLVTRKCDINCVVENGMVGFPGELGDWMDQHVMNPGTLRNLLKKLPPADSSYTLRVTDHGKPVLEYVIKNGDLVSVRRIKSKQ